MYYRWRTYDAGVARFNSRDPIVYLGGVNIYGYVFENPIGHTDPLGLAVFKSDVQKGKQVFTCNCGWIDVAGHVGGYAKKYKAIYDALKKGLKGSVELVSIVPKNLRADQRVVRRYDFDYSGTPNTDPVKAAFEILYRAAYQEELDQSGAGLPFGIGSGWTAFSFEDMASDMVGGLVGMEMIKNKLSEKKAIDAVLAKCGKVTTKEALEVFDDQASLTIRGKSISAIVKSAKQPQCSKAAEICKKRFPEYKGWDTYSSIATGQKPSGSQPIVKQ